MQSEPILKEQNPLRRVFLMDKEKTMRQRIFKILVIAFFICWQLIDFAYAKPSLSVDLFGVSFPNNKEGWVCGRGGTVLHTTDGGLNWVRQDTGTDYTLLSISFIDAMKGWAVGDEGTIVHTEDGGKTWAKQKSPVPYYLMAVSFVTPQNGWIVTERTHILHTNDGGKTWNVQFKGGDFILKSISFSDPLSGWAVGEYGFIYHTNNGGATWKQQAGYYRISEKDSEIEGGNFLFSVNAINAKTAWAVGIDGTVIKTVDGGVTWKEVATSQSKTHLFCVASDKKDTILIGGKGTFVVSTDGGRTWQAPKFEPPIPYDWIYGLALRDSSDFLAVGSQGAIYHADRNKIQSLWQRVVYK